MVHPSPDPQFIYKWIWKWKIIGLCMMFIGGVGIGSPYIMELIFDLDNMPILYLSISNLLSNFLLPCIVLLISGWMLVTCISEYDAHISGDVKA